MARYRNRRNKSNSFLYVLITLGILALLAGVGFLFYWQQNQKSITLDDRLCPINAPIEGHHVFLIDQTDPFTEIQQQAFKIKMQQMLVQVPQYHLVSVYTVNSDYKDHQTPLIERCNPGNGDGLSEMTNNVNKIKKRYQAEFVEPLQNLVTQIDTTIEDSSSPIMETIQTVNLNSFLKDPNDMQKHLVIVSDLIQNTPLINMYRTKNLNFKAFEKQFAYQKVSTNLSGVDVDILWLKRRPEIQNKALTDFWEQYFMNNHAQLKALEPLEG